jgi:hypothetical protein
MKTLNILATILFSLFSLNFCDDADLLLNDVAVKVLGQSGKIQIVKNYTSGNETNLETVTINFSALREKDENGTEVGYNGRVNHTFNNFAELNFTVGPVQEEKFQNLKVLSANLLAYLTDEANAEVMVRVDVFNETGVIETGVIENGRKETTKVKAGDVKFTFSIIKWWFCDGSVDNPIMRQFCRRGDSTETGAYLDFELEIKGQKAANRSLNSNSIYQLGNSELVLFNYVIIDDDKYTKLPENYPAYEREKDIFTIRFPKFRYSASSDFLVVMNSAEKESSLKTWLIIGIVVVTVVIAVVIFRFGLKCFKSGRKSETPLETQINSITDKI